MGPAAARLTATEAGAGTAVQQGRRYPRGFAEAEGYGAQVVAVLGRFPE